MSRNSDSLHILRLLVVSGSQDDIEGIQAALKQHGISTRIHAPTTAAEVMSTIHSGIDLIIADPHYPLVSFLDLTKEAHKVSFGKYEEPPPGSSQGIPVLAISSDVSGYEEWLAQGASGVLIRGQIQKFVRLIHQSWALVRAQRVAGFATRALEEAEIRCNALIDSSRDAIAYLHEGLHVRANAAYMELFKAETAEDLEGISLLDLVDPKQQGMAKDLIKRLGKGEKINEDVEFEAQSLDGSSWTALLRFTSATFDGERCLQMMVRKKEEDKGVSEEQLKALLSKDHVTGLYTRSAFLEALDGAIETAKKKEKTYAFLLVEPDNYGQLMGQVGLTHGDALVGAIAGRLVNIVRKTTGNDTNWKAGRLGDHQLALLAEVNGFEQAKGIASSIVEAMASGLIEAAHHSISITTCAGGVLLEQHASDLGTVLGKAHSIMHEIQQGSGNKSLMHDPGAADKKEEEGKQKLIDRIREAIDSDGFLVRYQPLVALHGTFREFYELHIDIPRKEGDTLIPDWLRAAGDAGLLWEVDRWRVARAISDMDMRARLGHETHILVSISVPSIQDDSLVQLIASELTRYPSLSGRGGERLTLMLPENQISTHLKLAQAFRLKMSNIGVHVGLDSFGGGMGGNGVEPSQILTHFGATRLRLSQEIVSGLMDSNRQPAMRALLAQVKAEKREILAAGVESAGAMSALFNAGADYAQGTFLAQVSSSMDHEF